MKTVLIICLSFLIALTSKSQESYIPMSVDQNTWIYKSQWHGDEPEFFGYRLEGDTIVEQVEYRKLFQLECNLDFDGNLEVYQIETPIGLMRDDSISRKAYVRLFNPEAHLNNSSLFNCIEYSEPQEDLLLFDFSVQVGDSLTGCDYLMINDVSPSVIHGFPSYTYEFDFGEVYMGIGNSKGLLYDVDFIFVAEYWQGLAYFYNGSLDDLDFQRYINSLEDLSYIPISKEGNLWIYSTTVDQSLVLYDGWYIEGDSILNQIPYKKVYKVDISLDEVENLIYNLKDTPFALVRDDTSNRKSYAVFLESPNMYTRADSFYNCLKYDDFNSEILLFDYGIEEQAVLDCDEDWFQTEFLGRKEVNYFGQKTYEFKNDYDIPMYMGFGPETDLFDPIFKRYIPEIVRKLKFFCNGSLDDCTFNIGPNSLLEVDESELQLYPNPVFDKLNIESASTIDKVEIYKLQGQLLQSQKVGLPAASIDLSHLESGIYLIRSYHSNSKISVEKFLKH